MTTRRELLAGGLAVAALSARSHAAEASVDLFAGTYQAEGGAGVVPFHYAPATDDWSLGTPVGSIVNASFGVHSQRFDRHYLLGEQASGTVAALAPGWRPRGVASTGGADPCHAALDARQSCLAVANYSSGSAALLRLDPATGAPIAPPLVRVHAGHGPVADRQAGPHAHWVGFSPDDRWLHAVDLGADAIFAHRFDAARGTIDAGVIAYRAPAGSGPRHLARHPRLRSAYLVSELANTVTVLTATPDGRFAARATLSTLPAGFTGHSQAAHIAINARGDRLYVSNRGHDSLAVFAIDRKGDLSLLQHLSSGGRWPRFFLLLDRQRRLVVANERSGTLAIFRIAADGRIAPTGQSLAVPGGVFIGRIGATA